MNPLDRCTECEEIELARVRDVPPSQTMPVPNAALAGFPEGRDRSGLTRRRLMAAGMAGVAAIYGPKALGWDEVWESVAQATVTPQNCLVVVYLAGGNDGLNTLVPMQSADYGYYASKRPLIHRLRNTPSAGGRVGSVALPGLAGTDLGWASVGVSSTGGGDNGDASFGFDKLYGDGTGGAGSDLAIMPAVDYLPGSLSHFDSSDHWFNGSLGATTTGWLGRWIDRNGSPTNPLQAVSLDTALSKSIRTSVNPVCAIDTLTGLGFSLTSNGGYGTSSYGGVSTPDAGVTSQISALAQTAAGNVQLQRTRAAFAQAAAVYTTGNGLASQALGTGYPANSQLSTKLKQAALLLDAGLGTRIITIHWGAFDTHGNQLEGQDPQLAELSRALGAFKADLATRGIEQNVSTLVFSEFGRRVAENGSGTDHGAGGLMMAMGSQVRGGYAAPFPGCSGAAALDGYGNLMVPTDFRSVYQTVLDEWLGDDPEAIIPGGPYPTLARPDGQPALFH